MCQEVQYVNMEEGRTTMYKERQHPELRDSQQSPTQGTARVLKNGDRIGQQYEQESIWLSVSGKTGSDGGL